MTKKEIKKVLNEKALNEVLEQMFDTAEIKSAHGGFAVVINKKRAFEVAQNKKTNLYKICTHFKTAKQADLVNTAECETQQNNYKFADLDTDDMIAVAQLLYKAKTVVMKSDKEK